MLNLKDLVIDTKTAEVEYPGYPDFKVKLQFVSRAASRKLLDQSTVKKYKNGQYIGDGTDDEKFAELFAKSAVVGWSGLTLDIVSDLLLIDAGDKDLDTPVEYSEDNAIMLMQNSVAFNRFVDGSVFEIDTFRTRKPE